MGKPLPISIPVETETALSARVHNKQNGLTSNCERDKGMDIFIGISKYFQRRVVGQSIYCNSPENFDSGGER